MEEVGGRGGDGREGEGEEEMGGRGRERKVEEVGGR